MPTVGAFLMAVARAASGVDGEASFPPPRAPPRPNRNAGLSRSARSGSTGTSVGGAAAAPRPPRPPRPAAAPRPPRPPRPPAGAAVVDGVRFQAATNSSLCSSVDQPVRLILIDSPAPLTFSVVAVKWALAGAFAGVCAANVQTKAARQNAMAVLTRMN